MRYRNSAAILLAGAAAIAASAVPASAHCNIGGKFCDYPAWSANAFAGQNRVNLNAGPVLHSIHRERRYDAPVEVYVEVPPPPYAYEPGPRVYGYRYEKW